MQMLHLNSTNELIPHSPPKLFTMYEHTTYLENLIYLFNNRKEKVSYGYVHFPEGETEAQWKSLRCPRTSKLHKPPCSQWRALFTEISLKITRERERAGSRSKQKRVALNNRNHSALCKPWTWLESYIHNLRHHFTSKSTHKTHDQNKVTSGELSPGKVVVITKGLVSLPFAAQRGGCLPPKWGQSHFPTGLI